mmetsp:Transcript_69729/g.167395  ORF Transcript_69729/g.167395 Transcript_69729/m.167395 type:complete len:391 (-) Transcript_69729:68-1240(-)
MAEEEEATKDAEMTETAETAAPPAETETAAPPAEAETAAPGPPAGEASPASAAAAAAAAPSADEILQLARVLEEAPKAEKKEEVLEALRKLRSFGSLPAKLVKDTSIGLTVNTVAKADVDSEVKESAKGLLTEWREAHRRKRQASSGNLGESSQPLKRLNSTQSDRGEALSQPALSQLSASELSQELNQDAASASAAPELGGGDSQKIIDLRDKVRQKLIDAMGKEEQVIESKDEKDGNEEQRDPVVLAKEIEEHLYVELLKGRDEKKTQEYNNQARAVIHNLKDPKNPTFRFKLIVGYYAPERVPTLSAEEMASDVKNAERAKIRQDAAEAIQSDWAIRHGATRISGMFTCGRCKGTRTTYFQMQTRSSDEPMTTFVTCLTCSNRWKFC